MDIFKNYQSNKQAQISAFDSFKNRFGSKQSTTPTTKNAVFANDPSESFKNQSIGTAKIKNPNQTFGTPSTQNIVKTDDLNSNKFNQITQPKPEIANYGITPTPEPKPQEQQKQKTASEILREKILNEAESTNLSDQRAKIRQEEGTAQKLKRANELAQRYDAEQLKLQDRIDRLEKNPEGNWGGALQRQVSKMTYEGNKALTLLALQNRIASDDYQGAEKIVEQRISDLVSDRDYKLKAYQTAYDFTQNDMSDSEKIKANQEFELLKMNTEAELEGEKALLENAKINEEAIKTAEGYKNGLISEESLNKLPDEVKTAVWSKLVSDKFVSPAQLDQLRTMKKNLSNVDELLTKGTSLAVGSGLARTTGEVLGFFGATRTKDVQATIDNLETNLAKEVLPLMKGPTSDRDIEFIKASAAKLQKTQSQEQFQENLLQLRRGIKNGLVNSLIIPKSEKETILKEHYVLENSVLPTKDKLTAEQISDMIEIELDSLPTYGADSEVSSITIPQASRLSYINNNPGNLRFAGQDGAVNGEGGFAKFKTPEAGYSALKRQIALDKARDLSVESFITKFAPPSENNTSEYISFVSNKLGVNPRDKIKNLSTDELAKVIAQKESSTLIS